MAETVKTLTSGRLLARSALWNFIGLGAPMLMALIAIPLLIDGMGKERFGLLAIIWMGVGYFSLFDLGLGRALTKLVAERLGSGRFDDLGPLIWTALSLLVAFGVFGAIVVFVAAGPLVQHLLNVKLQYQDEAVAAFRILALGLPVVVATAALVGLLEAHQRFASITAIRIPLGVMTFAGPLATLQFTPSLVWATAVLLLSRMVALFVYFVVVSSVRPELRTPTLPQRSFARPLFLFGGWLTVTNIVGPLMTYLDRFFLGAVLNMTAVTYYVTPYEVLSRLQMLPQSIMGVMFPAMSTAFGGDRVRLTIIYSQSSRLLLSMMLPIISAFFLFAPEALEIWLGNDFRLAATPVVHWLALGAMINVLAQPAFTVLQSAGRPDIVAKVHLAELVPYLLVLWFFTHAFGIAGTAAAWTLRVLVDTVVLNELARWTLTDLKRAVQQTHIALVAILIGFFCAWMLESLLARAALLALLMAGSGVVLWPLTKHLRTQPVAPQV
jgi:O-antigen/teichoic acid export membrane protein